MESLQFVDIPGALFYASVIDTVFNQGIARGLFAVSLLVFTFLSDSLSVALSIYNFENITFIY